MPTGEHLAIIEHTDVDESLKGQGIGKRLVAKVVEKMRRESQGQELMIHHRRYDRLAV